MTHPAFLDNLRSQRHLFRQVTKEGKFAVYAYLRETDGTPYYIGLHGSDNRAYSKLHFVAVPKVELVRLLKVFSTRQAAGIYESKLIAKYGRKAYGTGILRNLAEGGEASAQGCIRSEKTKALMSLSQKGMPRPEGAAEKGAYTKLIKVAQTYNLPLSYVSRFTEYERKLAAMRFKAGVRGRNLFTSLDQLMAEQYGISKNVWQALNKNCRKTVCKRYKRGLRGDELLSYLQEATRFEVDPRTVEKAVKMQICVSVYVRLDRRTRQNICKRFASGKRGDELLQGIAA